MDFEHLIANHVPHSAIELRGQPDYEKMCGEVCLTFLRCATTPTFSLEDLVAFAMVRWIPRNFMLDYIQRWEFEENGCVEEIPSCYDCTVWKIVKLPSEKT